ncbi:FGGY-family carbohydrate kinase [Paenibacillus sp. GCM10023248]|uniref:FGGY-family carbohydrate kinase n=1 Tax=Bacillales TaxID=1385 RepID=UPI0023789439|nr:MULTISPECIES: FGGY family carbohydrate kinase [Bacillales]MDD9265506.1 FGGY family carbohydrate kinase [Paenibacillus sp. MAHUQ-63]MDR6882441.1 sugar (pentulose or hexulose) kinase [Bacillus sp. 3255]
MSKYVMGIDNGSQSTKVAIYDLDGNEVAFGSNKLRETLSPEPGVVIHPDDDLWDSVYGGIKNCLANFKGDPAHIAGIGLCTIRCCRVLLKENGHPAYPVISWMDARLNKPYEHTDEQVKYVTTTSGYLGFRLTGEFKDTASNYEVHWPLNRETLEWSNDDEVMKANGLKREMLFDLVKPGDKLGTLRPELAREFGLNKGIPVVATANDKAVEVLGSGIKDEGSIMISLGTFISSMLFRNEYYENARNFFPTLACIPFKYVYESNGIRRGMWTVSWFKKLIGEELVTHAEKLDISEEEYLNLKAQDVPVGSEGLITILDWLSSSSFPYRKGIMIGFDQRHTKYHIYRSILEAISFNIKNNIDEMLEEIDVELYELVVIGGGSKSDLLMQIIADLFGLPVHRREGSSSACLGAAICACHYLEVYKDFYEAANKMVKTERTFLPSQKNHEFYNQINNNIVKNIRAHTDEILKQTYPIFH